MRAPAGSGSPERGYTLMELAAVALLLTPMVGALMTSGRLVVGSIEGNDRAAEASHLVRAAASGIERAARSGLRSSCEVRATAADVNYYVTNSLTPVPAVGDWIPARDLDPHSTLRFKATGGTPSLNATALATMRTFEFVLEDGELDNDTDDDGDGLVDEGRLTLLVDGETTTILTRVEECSFELDEALLRLRLQCARTDSGKTVHRRLFLQSVLMRND